MNSWHVRCWCGLREIKNAGEASPYLDIPKISLGKKPAAKTNDSEENEVAKRVTEKKEDAPQEKEEEPAADETRPTE